jgi:hypothetical protein
MFLVHFGCSCAGHNGWHLWFEANTAVEAIDIALGLVPVCANCNKLVVECGGITKEVRNEL